MKKKSPRRERKMIALPYRVWRMLQAERRHQQEGADWACDHEGIMPVNLSLADAVEALCRQEKFRREKESKKGGEGNHA